MINGAGINGAGESRTEIGEEDPGRASIALVAEPAARTRIRSILATEPVRLTEHESGDLLLADPPTPDPDLLVLWLANTDSPSLARIASVTERFRSSPVLAVFPGVKRWDVRAALAAGAAGVVRCDDLERALIPSIAALRSGQACAPSGHRLEFDPPALSSREKQVLGLAVMGYMNSQIAGRLVLAESTVKSHLSSVFGKLGVRSRHEAADLVIDIDRGLGIDIHMLGVLASQTGMGVEEETLQGRTREPSMRTRSSS